jgi:16S rRNA (guanine527-N7)-methyltransferase
MPDPEFERSLRAVLSTLCLAPDADQLAKLQFHFELLQRWNRRISLTSIRNPGEIASRHFGESLFLATTLPEQGTLADVGSGPGFPGIPIAVIKPRFQVTLIESVAKKATFLKEVTRDYRNVRVLQARVESVASRFDWATMRAVAPAPLLVSLSSRVTNLALLIGEKDAARLACSKLFDWEPPCLLPWGNRRVLLVGRSLDTRST